MTTWKTLSVVLFLGVALIACTEEKPAVSLAEARRVTADFQGQGFVPPPRTITDIAAILDQEKPDPTKFAATKAAADREPPAGLQGGALAQFYFERGLAAGEIGRARQRLGDLREAERLGRDATDGVDYLRVLQALGLAEMQAGNPRSARDQRRKAIELQEGTQTSQGRLFALYAQLINVSAFLGDFDDAKASLGKAQRLISAARGWRFYPLYGSSWEASVLDAEAVMQEVAGQYSEAERTLRRVQSQIVEVQRVLPRWEARPPPGAIEQWADLTTRNLARVLMRQGRLVEAEVEIRKGLLSQLKRRGRYATETAVFISAFADILLEQSRADEAEKLALATIDVFERAGHGAGSRQLSYARQQLARAKLSQGRHQEAVDVYRRAEADIAPEDRDRTIGLNLGYALALMWTGSVDESITILTRLTDRRRQILGERHYHTAEARGMLGAALARTPDKARALSEIRAALPILLSPSRESEDEQGLVARERRLAVILESYVRLLADLHGAPLANAIGADPAEEAFRIAQAAARSSVQRALTASSARAAARDPELADLVRREQDAQKQIGAMFGLLSDILARPSEERDDNVIRPLRAHIDQLRGARATMREEIERRFPDYVNLIDPRPATVADARQALAAGESLIATYLAADRTFVWAIPRQGEIAFASVPHGRDQLARMVTDLRRALDPNVATLGDIPAFDVTLAHRLFQLLLVPVEKGWREANSLVVVADKALGQIPFHLLVTAPHQVAPEPEGSALFASYRAVPWLARKVAVTQIPSVNALATLRKAPPSRAARAFAGFGDPWFSAEQARLAEAAGPTTSAALQSRGSRTIVATRGLPLVRRNAPATQTVDSAELAQLPRLPDTADEVKGVALALKADPAKDVFLGRAASERTAKTADLSDRRVIMFATHGLVPGDLNGLTQPALALSAPAVADADGDGLLTLDEILALKLDADWVVLSACNTATGDGAGAEAVSGLGRAFFYAGTRALLVSNWPVETTSARVLTIDLFKRQAENALLARAEALRQAMLGLIDGPDHVDGETRRPVFSYAHPIFWAPFSLVGDGAGRASGG